MEETNNNKVSLTRFIVYISVYKLYSGCFLDILFIIQFGSFAMSDQF